jgi:hypothetical protein
MLMTTAMMPFTLQDQNGARQLQGRVELAPNGQLCLYLDGYGDFCSTPGQGVPILLELLEGKPRLIVWADISREEPTHIIDLSGAAEASQHGERLVSE